MSQIKKKNIPQNSLQMGASINKDTKDPTKYSHNPSPKTQGHHSIYCKVLFTKHDNEDTPYDGVWYCDK